MTKHPRIILLILSLVVCRISLADPVEIYCTIRASGGSLNCQELNGKERKVMSPDDVTNFIDAGEIAAYITLKSRKGIERTYLVDPKAQQFKRLNDIKRTAPISDIARAKSDLFADIEKKVIKLSDELDGQAAAAELVLYDSGITYSKLKREQRAAMAELERYRQNKEARCTTTPAFEQVSKANGRLQHILSSIVYAFQSPDTCMADYKIFKDQDGAIDLRQLDTVGDYFKKECKKK